MITTIRRFLFSGLILAATQYFMGCCLIGAGIGAAKDAKKPEYSAFNVPGVSVPKESASESPTPSKRELKNKRVYITLKNGDILIGKYLATVEENGLTYVQIKRDKQKQLIAKDEILSLQRESERAALRRKTLYVTTTKSDTITAGRFERVFMDGDRLYMVFEKDGEEQRFARDEITSIYFKNSKHGAVKGFFIGAMIDAAVVGTVAVVALSNWDMNLDMSGLDFGNAISY